MAAQPLGSAVVICAVIKKVTDDVIVMGFVAFHLSSNDHLSYEVSLCLDLKCLSNYAEQPRLKL